MSGKLMGKSGYVIVSPVQTVPSSPSYVECIDTWSLAWAGDAIETTGFGSTSEVISKTFEMGLKSATGNAAGTYDGDDTALSTLATIFINSEVSVINAVFYMDASHHVSVVCIMTGFSINDPVADKVTFGFDFTCSGSPVLA